MKEPYKKIISIFICFFIMVIGLGLFKYLPMQVYGENILFDASAHVVWTSFLLYTFWLVVEKHNKLRIPFFVVAWVVLVAISMERLIIGAHNLIGVALGFGISFIAVAISRWNNSNKHK